MIRLLALLASKKALLEARDRAYALCESLRLDHAETQRELREQGHELAATRQSFAEVMEMGLQLQRERDAARQLAHDALVIAGWDKAWDWIASLPTWGEMQ